MIMPRIQWIQIWKKVGNICHLLNIFCQGYHHYNDNSKSYDCPDLKVEFMHSFVVICAQINSLASGWLWLKNVRFSNSLHTIVAWALAIKLLSGERHRTSLININICSGDGLVQQGSNIDPALCFHMASLVHYVLNLVALLDFLHLNVFIGSHGHIYVFINPLTVLWNKLQRNFNRNSYFPIQENASENVICKTVPFFSASVN